MQAQARRSRKNSRVLYPRSPPSSPSPSLLSSLFIPAFPRTLPAPFERRRPRPWPPLPVVKLPHETFLMSNRGDLRLSLSLSLFFPSSPFLSLRPPQLFLFLAVHPSVFLPFRTFAELSPAFPFRPAIGLFSEGRFSLFCFFAVLPPPNSVADARTTAMVAATLAIVRERSAECRITSGCDAINARIMLNIASLIRHGSVGVAREYSLIEKCIECKMSADLKLFTFYFYAQTINCKGTEVSIINYFF